MHSEEYKRRGDFIFFEIDFKQGEDEKGYWVKKWAIRVKLPKRGASRWEGQWKTWEYVHRDKL